MPPTLEASRPKLKRSIGLWMATALVVGNMVGSGIFTLPALLAGEAGPASIVSLALTGLGAILLALVFAGLGRKYPHTGGPYVYARKAFGDFAGFWTAWGYWIAAWAGNAAIAIAFVGYFGVFWGRLDNSNITAALVAVGLIWLLTLVNILGARESGWVTVVTTVLKFVPLAAIGVIGLFYIAGDNYTPFAPAGTGFDWHINAAATLALWAFIGLESATVPAEEVKDAEKTIPRATILGTLVTTLLYLIALVAIIGVLPRVALSNSASPFADAADAMWGGAFLGLSWGKWIALVAMASTLGCLNGWILLAGRVPLAAANDGLFPKPFAQVSGTRRTPVFALVVSAVLVTGLVFMNYNKSLIHQFEQVILLATLTTLVPYAFSAAAQAYLWVVERETFNVRRFVTDIVVASLAFTYSLWAIWGAGEEIIAKGFMLLLFGMPIYVWLKWRQAHGKEEHLFVPDEFTQPEPRVPTLH
jgi:APA family basic amino acid/polyamine antiporter